MNTRQTRRDSNLFYEIQNKCLRLASFVFTLLWMDISLYVISSFLLFVQNIVNSSSCYCVYVVLFSIDNRLISTHFSSKSCLRRAPHLFRFPGLELSPLLAQKDKPCNNPSKVRPIPDWPHSFMSKSRIPSSPC